MKPNRTEDKQINFRVSQQEFLRLQDIANNLGISVPMLCKKKALSIRLKAPLLSKDSALLISSELRKLGNNVNQIAKYLHSGAFVSKEQFDYIGLELSHLWQLLNSALHTQPID